MQEAMLAHFDGLRLPQWPYSIGITTLISLLSVLQRSAPFDAIATIISQAKWAWISQPWPHTRFQRLGLLRRRHREQLGGNYCSAATAQHPQAALNYITCTIQEEAGVAFPVPENL